MPSSMSEPATSELPAHIAHWLRSRGIDLPQGDPLPALQDGRLLLQALHCHVEHTVRVGPDRLERWKTIATMLLDAGIEMTDVGLRMALLGERQTLLAVLGAVYSLFHADAVPLQVHLDPEPVAHYPPLTQHLLAQASTYDDYVDRLRVFLHAEHPQASQAELAALVMEAIAGRLDQVCRLPEGADVLALVVGQMRSPTPSTSLRAAAILQTLTATVGPAVIFDWLVEACGGQSPRLRQAQDHFVLVLLAPTSSPELLVFLHSFLVEISVPHRLRGMVEGLLLPRLTEDDALHEIARLAAAPEVLACPDAAWVVAHVAERVMALSSQGVTERLEVATSLLLRLWSEVPEVAEASGALPQLRSFLAAPVGVRLVCRHSVLCELCSVVFVAPEAYAIILHALSLCFHETHLRRPLLRALTQLHEASSLLPVAPLVEFLVPELAAVPCAVAEGELVAHLGQHPQLLSSFSDLTAGWMDLLLALLRDAPFVHTHATQALLQLAQAFAADAEFPAALGVLTEDLLEAARGHAQASLVLRAIGRLYAAAPADLREAAIRQRVFLFAQRCIRVAEETDAAGLAEAEEQAAAEVQAATDGDAPGYLRALLHLCDELDLPPHRVPVPELDPEPEPEPVDAPESEGWSDVEAEEGAGEEGAAEDEEPLGLEYDADGVEFTPPRPEALSGFDAAEDVFNVSRPTDDGADGMGPSPSGSGSPGATGAGAKSVLRTAGAKRRAAEQRKATALRETQRQAQERSRLALEALQAKKVTQFITTAVVEPLLCGVLERIHKMEFRRRLKERGSMDPSRRVPASAKALHDEKIALAKAQQEQQEREAKERRDKVRANRDRLIKRRIEERRRQEALDSTPQSGVFFDRALHDARREETAARKAVLAAEAKAFVQLYRDRRSEAGRLSAEDEQRAAEALKAERAEQKRHRDHVKARLQAYRQLRKDDEAARRKAEEAAAQQEAEERQLRFARRADVQKRRLLRHQESIAVQSHDPRLSKTSPLSKTAGRRLAPLDAGPGDNRRQTSTPPP